MNEMQIETIGQLRADNYTYASIGKTLGISPNIIKSVCRKYEFMPRENTPQKNINKAVEIEQLPRCKFCGRTMDNPWNRVGKTFCSDKCRYSWWNRERRIMGHIPAQRRENLPQKTLDFLPQKRD